ncbi:MAG: recombinase family protein [Sandarakinorhabdus sp.]|nr:recombinase family protein [Sandarakinorhabdus sp.]
MLVGYERISTDGGRQSEDLQRDALVAAGVDARHIYGDKLSGSRDDRPGLKDCLTFLKSGDTLVVCKLDRLGRSLSHLLERCLGKSAHSAKWRFCLKAARIAAEQEIR